MNIAVRGGGNIGTQFACVCASRGHRVSVYTSKPELWSMDIEAHNDDGSITHGRVALVSDNVAEVLNEHEIIFITVKFFNIKKSVFFNGIN